MKKLLYIACTLMILMFSCFPVEAAENFHIASEFAILINLDDGEILYEKQSETRMYPASMTKIMTVLTALEHIDNLDETVTVTNEMLFDLVEENASIAGFLAGETVSMRDLLYGVMLPSGADACRALAFHIAGSEEAFADLMNQKVTQMNLKNTHFVNATGLHDDDHYTTVKEMAEILKAAIQNDTFFEIFTALSYTTSSTDQHPDGIDLMSSVRKLERTYGFRYDTITGAKTGFTLEGGLCLASIGFHDHARYLLVTGNAGKDASYPQHVADAHEIYEHMYETYDYLNVWNHEQEIDTIHMKYNFLHRTYDIVAESDIFAFVNRSYDINQIQVAFDGPDTMEAPIEKGQFLGNIIVVYQGETLKQIPVYAQENIGRNWLLYALAVIIDVIVSLRYVLLTVIISFIGWVGYRRYKVIQRRKRKKHRRK